MFVKVCLDTVETTSTVLFIVAAASIFGWMLTATGVTAAIAQWVLAFTREPWMFLLLANLLMLFVGCFLEPTAAITILVPILLPIARQLGIDPVHFGLVMVLNLMIGLLHPPMGMVLFVLARVAKLERRAHDDGDPAVAGAAARQPGDPHLCAAARAVAAAHAGDGWLMSLPPGRPKEGSLPLGGTARSAKGAPREHRIERVELLLVDLPPPVPRSDAIQSFVVQETPIVRIAWTTVRRAPATATPSAPAARR